MLLRLFLLFAVVALVELTLLVWLARATSFWVTLAIVLATGLLGAVLARRQGATAWRRIHNEMAAGRPPAAAVLDGVMILIAAVLLIAPGLLTDGIGFALLIPPLRRGLQRILLVWLTRRASMRFQTFTSGWPEAHRPPDDSRPTVIDAEFTREPADPDDRDTPRLP